MKTHALRHQLGAIFLGFLLLVLSSAAITFWLVQTQQNDAVIINLAGRQRMLAQQMTRLALTDPYNPELEATITRFEQTLAALSQGGEVIDGNGRSLTISPAANPTIQSLFREITTQWLSFQAHLQPPVDRILLETDFATLLTQLDDAVSAYEAEAQAKIVRLRWVQIVFLVAAFMLLAWGYHLVHHQLVWPLTTLRAAAEEIGAGKRNTAIPSLPSFELNLLGQTMEKMRREIAIYQNSLEQKVSQRTQELSTAFKFSQEIVRELEPAHLLQSVADHTRDLMQGTAVSVCLLDDNGDPNTASGFTLELVASSGSGRQHIGLRQSAARGIALPVIQQRKTVTVEGGCANCGFLHYFPGNSCVAAPLQVGGRALGALCVVRPQMPFDADETRALTLLANSAAVTLENARLIESGKKQAEQNAVLAEREQLAANLHDNLAQTLGAMHLSVDLLSTTLLLEEGELARQRLNALQNDLRKAYAQVRMALTGLRESAPDEADFMTALQSIVTDFEVTTQLPISVSLNGKEGPRLTTVSQKQVLHILREALTNVRRHAQAAQVHISITQNDEMFTLDIVDDGLGFDVNRVDSQNHLGLNIMQARAERCQGQLTIQSAPGTGTRLTAIFPTIQTREQEPETS